jgi:GH25 family lysozyme M1 (1,4-beta-N-acetylmuramidase)
VAIYGWDASNHDWGRGSMNFVAAKQAGISFFVHKCTDGDRYYRDPYFARAMAGAKSAGIPLLGAYHVLWNKNPLPQMDWFMSILDKDAPGWRHGGFILQLDCEPFGYNGGAPSPPTIKTAADYLKAKTGYTPVVYGPKWVYGDSLHGLGYPLWASNYGTNASNTLAGLRAIADNSARWSTYSGQTPAILQFGSKAVIGTQSTCDVNAYRGTLADLRALIGSRSTESAVISEGDDDMALGIPPTEIPASGVGSFTIWPVNAGAAGHGPAWLNIGNDTNGATYRVRVWGSKGDKNWFPLGNNTDGVVSIESGELWGVPLPDATRILSIGRPDGNKYTGPLSFCVEYGRRT